jgi:BCCT family betaine/carnitine transporter
MLGWGSLGCALFFIVLGNYALYLEVNGIYAVVDEAVNVGPSTAIASIIALLPLGSLWLVFIAVIGLIFMVTTYDSASYTLAAGATRAMQEHEHPARWHRVFWAMGLGLLPLSLLFAGGLRELQTASMLASIPLVGVYGLLAVSIVRMLNSQER